MKPEIQDQYDEAMFLFSQEKYTASATLLEEILKKEPMIFEVRLSLGMVYCRLGDYKKAIAEGHLAEKMKPNEQLVHTNLSLFYVKIGNRERAEHHGLKAKIASWKNDASSNSSNASSSNSDSSNSSSNDSSDSELSLAKPKLKTFKTPSKFPDMPWKKNESI